MRKRIKTTVATSKAGCTMLIADSINSANTKPITNRVFQAYLVVSAARKEVKVFFGVEPDKSFKEEYQLLFTVTGTTPVTDAIDFGKQWFKRHFRGEVINVLNLYPGYGRSLASAIIKPSVY